MTLHASVGRYDRVAIALHWSAALLVVIALLSGFAVEAFGRSAHSLLRVHVLAGGLAGLLTLLRIAWMFVERRPAVAPNTKGARRPLVLGVHALLRLIPLGMAVSGAGLLLLSGGADQLLTGNPGVLPNFDELLPKRPHSLGAAVLLVLILLHAGASLYHHFVLRDGLLRRIAFVRPKS